MENNAFDFGHVEIKLPELHFFFPFYLSSLFQSVLSICSRTKQKCVKSELGLHFETETAEYMGSRIFNVYSMLIYLENGPGSHLLIVKRDKNQCTEFALREFIS